MPLSVLGALSSLFGSTYAADKQNQAIDKQIEAQRDENDKTRQYNLNLAKMQNQWNIDQYNRENAYNTPAAQMQRFKAAGLNPNLIYGQVNNTPVSIAGSLSSGAPATPTDMSALGGKRSGLASMFSQLGKSLLEIPMYREEVRNKRLENEERELDIAAKRDEKNIRDWLNSIFTDGDVPDNDTINELFGMMNMRQLSALNGIRQQSASLHGSEQQNRLFDKNFDNMVREVANRADISSADAKYWLNTLYGRIDRTNTESKMNSLEDMPEFTQKGLKIIKIINEVVGQYIPMMKFK